MRVIEYYVEVEGQDVREMFCLATDLDDWHAYPAAVLAAADSWRWDGSETALREAKSAIRGASPSTGPIFRSHTPGMRRRVPADRDQHRDHKTKARQAFPAAGRSTPARTAPAKITICGPIAA